MAWHLDSKGAIMLTWSMLSRHAWLVSKMQHDASMVAGIALSLHAWLASVFY